MATPFGHPGGARGVDEVSDVLGGRGRQARAGLGVDGRVFDIDDRHVASVQPLGQPGGGDRDQRRGISHHELHPRRRQPRVDRQIRRPRLEHRQHRHDRLGGTLQHQRHTLPRAHTLPGQQMRQPVGGLLNLAVRHGAALEGHRHRLRGARHPVGEHHRNRHRCCGLGQHRAVTDLIQPFVLSGIQQIHRRQPPRRVGGDRHQHPPPPLDQRLDAGRVEHVGAKLHHPTDPGRLTSLSEAFTQGEGQIHPRGVGVGRQRGDPQITQHQPGGGIAGPARAGSARPTPPAPAGDGSGIGSG